MMRYEPAVKIVALGRCTHVVGYNQSEAQALCESTHPLMDHTGGPRFHSSTLNLKLTHELQAAGEEYAGGDPAVRTPERLPRGLHETTTANN